MAADIVISQVLYNSIIMPNSMGYSSLNQKQTFWSKHNLSYKRIDAIAQFECLREECKGKPYIFRGIKNAKFKLLTSLQVAYQQKELQEIPYEDRVLFVQKEIDSIRKNKDKYIEDKQLLPEMEDIDFLYMSFMQHFGLYTPFLDFSYNLDKALFFAQDEMDNKESETDIENYVSLYWLQPRNNNHKQHPNPTLQRLIDAGVQPNNELINIVEFYMNSLLRVIPDIKNAMKEYKYIDTKNIEPHNFYSWCCNTNNGEGLTKLDLGYLADNFTKQDETKTFKELIEWLDYLKPQMKNETLSEDEYNAYLKALQNSLEDNIRLVNSNLNAQEGCFIFFNPSQKDISLEEFWTDSHIIYKNLPMLHCVDINKQVIVDYIRPMLEKLNINTKIIYPKGRDAAKQDLKFYLEKVKALKKI